MSDENKSDKKSHNKNATMTQSSRENIINSFLLYNLMLMKSRNIPAEKKRKKFLDTKNGSVYCFDITNDEIKVTENNIARQCLIFITSLMKMQFI
jgi:hypothetical protein